ncbi:ovarian tumor [Carabus blaptoides fortunei]
MKNKAIMEYKPKKTLDIWLNDKGFYRKHIALDETCLFRAVSDQVYNTQVYHEDIRTRCILYAVEHKDEFKEYVTDWDGHIHKLRNHSVFCGDTEIQILSKLFKRDFIIFNEFDFSIKNVTNNDYKEILLLCKMKGNHFDSIIEKKKIETEGFCQSLVYKILYEKVFDIDNVDSIVDSMLNDPKKLNKDNSKLDAFDLPVPKKESNTEQLNFEESLDISEISEIDDVFPPFPYKVAKALDPNQYRNVAYDAWNQVRKDIRIKDWYMGGNDFKVGTKCILDSDGQSLNCYIQELNYEREDMCLVYVVEAAERRVVNLRDLRPHPQAKPWPMPIYVTRNTRKMKFSHNEQTELRDDRKRKYTNKRRCYSEGTVSWMNRSSASDTCDMQSVASLEGCPFIASMCTQFTDTFKLNPDDCETTNFNSDLCNNNEPNVDCPSDNQLVHYENLNHYSMQSFVPVVQGDMPVQNIPLILPQKSVAPNGTDLPFHDLYALRYYFNVGVECVRQNYWQMWLPPLPGPTPVPLMTPDTTGAPYSPPPQMCVAAQLNMVQHNNDTKYTFYSQFIKENQVYKNFCFAETFNINNNNCALNYNYNEFPAVDPPLNYVPEMPYTCPPPNITIPPPALPLDLNLHRAPYPDVAQPYMAPMYLPMVPPMQYYPAGLPPSLVPCPVPPAGSIPMVENTYSSIM